MKVFSERYLKDGILERDVYSIIFIFNEQTNIEPE